MVKKEEEVADALEIFFDQFGKSDIYTQIVLEEFFKRLLDESIHLHGEVK